MYNEQWQQAMWQSHGPGTFTGNPGVYDSNQLMDHRYMPEQQSMQSDPVGARHPQGIVNQARAGGFQQKMPSMGLGLPSTLQRRAVSGPAPSQHTGNSGRNTMDSVTNDAPAVALETLMTSLILNQEKALRQNDELKQQNEEVQKRLASLEQKHSVGLDVETQDKPARKKAKSRKRALVGIVEEANVDAGIEDLGLRKDHLSSEAQLLRKYLHTETTVKFRALCGVPAGSPWPDPNEIRINETTNEQYIMPLFKEQVTHDTNKVYFKTVARLVLSDLQDPQDCPPGLHDKTKYTWSQKTIEEFAKETFRNLKPSWKAQSSALEGKKLSKHQRNNRMASRRAEKYGRRLSVVTEYKALHPDRGDPSELLCPEHMSDEASGAEDDDNEEFEDWKTRMLSAANMSGSQSMRDRLKVFEVVKPEWRSDELTEVFHELQKLWSDKLSHKQKMSYAVRVYETGRSSAVPPLIAPFNFGIDPSWWSKYGDAADYKAQLSDWMSYPTPKEYKPMARTSQAGESETVEATSVEGVFGDTLTKD